MTEDLDPIDAEWQAYSRTTVAQAEVLAFRCRVLGRAIAASLTRLSDRLTERRRRPRR